MSFNGVRGLHLSDPNSHFTALFQESKILRGKDRSNRGLAGDFYGPDVRLSNSRETDFRPEKLFHEHNVHCQNLKFLNNFESF